VIRNFLTTGIIATIFLIGQLLGSACRGLHNKEPKLLDTCALLIVTQRVCGSHMHCMLNGALHVPLTEPLVHFIRFTQGNSAANCVSHATSSRSSTGCPMFIACLHSSISINLLLLSTTSQSWFSPCIHASSLNKNILKMSSISCFLRRPRM
jgi:hypothetical protein